MRHQNKTRNIGSASASHRHSKLNLLASGLFKNKKIITTLAKAKATRIFSEKLITIAKRKDVHSRRLVARYIKDRVILKSLFDEIVDKINDRQGGYTRIVKIGHRYGDGAEMAILELVDYNNVAAEKKEKTTTEKEHVQKEKKEEPVKAETEVKETEQTKE